MHDLDNTSLRVQLNGSFTASTCVWLDAAAVWPDKLLETDQSDHSEKWTFELQAFHIFSHFSHMFTIAHGFHLLHFTSTGPTGPTGPQVIKPLYAEIVPPHMIAQACITTALRHGVSGVRMSPPGKDWEIGWNLGQPSNLSISSLRLGKWM